MSSSERPYLEEHLFDFSREFLLDNGVDAPNMITLVLLDGSKRKGIVLRGPDPKTLVDPISSKDLALDNRDMLRIVHEKWATEDALKTRMLQTFFVTLCVRVLHTLETGVVTSKKAATEWAMKKLDLKWLMCASADVRNNTVKYSRIEEPSSPLPLWLD